MSALTEGDTRPHVVIVGGGFGGLETAKALRGAPVRVTLVDRHNHHLFQPLLYQVAMAGLSPAEIAIPIRSVLRKQENVRVLMGTVSSFDLDARRVYLEDGLSLPYDYLVVAAGARTHYFGNPDWAEHAMGLKSIEDALEIRRRVLHCYERAERTEDEDERQRLLTFVIIGGGPTGVELAGALSELGKRVLAPDYRNIGPDSTRVVLLEAADRVLPPFAESLSESARQQLEDLAVEIQTGRMVKKIDAQGVHLEDEVIPAGALIWSAGVVANPLAERLGVELDRRGRIMVGKDCAVPGRPEVFAVGDIALFLDDDGNPLPGVSPVAMQQGRHVARLIRREFEGQEREEFEYFDKGMMATIGRSRAVAQAGKLKMTGFIAWLAWLFVHLWYLVGFKNRIIVLLQWVLSYVMYRRGARLITGREPKPPAEAKEKAA